MVLHLIPLWTPGEHSESREGKFHEIGYTQLIVYSHTRYFLTIKDMLITVFHMDSAFFTAFWPLVIFHSYNSKLFTFYHMDFFLCIFTFFHMDSVFSCSFSSVCLLWNLSDNEACFCCSKLCINSLLISSCSIINSSL